MVGLVCNEEGKLQGLPANRALYHEGEIYDIICGTFLVVGLTEENFGSLTDEQALHYAAMYMAPEMFMKAHGKILAIPMI